MDFFISAAHAQAAAPAAAPNPLMSFLPLVILFGIFYFMLIRPQMKRAKEQRAMIAALARGDEVLTNGGVLGRVEDIAEQYVTLEIAEGVKVRLQKQAISAVLPKGTLKASGTMPAGTGQTGCRHDAGTAAAASRRTAVPHRIPE
jgi:preprotein translocase subunit YajC